MIQAIKYFERALKSDQRNFYCLNDLLRTYMGQPSRYSKEIDEVLDRSLNDKYYQGLPKKRGNILFTKAIIKYLDGQKKESVDLLVESYLLCSDSKDLFKVRTPFY